MSDFFPENISGYSADKLKAFLDEHTEAFLRKIEPPRATLRRLDGGLASKDFLDCSPLYRMTLGRWLLRREYNIYRRLDGIDGIAGGVSMPCADLLCMDFIEGGLDLKQVEPGKLPHSALDQLRSILDAVHARGVIHFDLGHDSNGDYGRETNMLWKDGRLYIIDFAGSLYGLPRPLFNILAVHDRMAVAKVMRRFFPDEPVDPQYLPTPAQERWLRRFRKF